MSQATDGALLLKELRRARGWSWKDEARELRRHAQRLHIERVASASVDSIARTIARWESGHYPHRPDQRYQLLLGHTYATKDGRASLGPLSDFERLLAALTAFGGPAEERQLVRRLVTASFLRSDVAFPALFAPALQARLAAALDNPDRLDAQILDGLEASVANLRWQTAPAAPFMRLRLAVAPALEVLERLRQASPSSLLRERLCEVTARSLAFAGRLSFELHDDEAAAALFSAALGAADEVRDGRTKAATLTSWSMVTLHSRRGIAGAEGRAHQAVSAALRGGSEAVRARAFAVEAEVHAGKGDARRTVNALRCAERHLARQSRQEGPDTFDHHGLEGFRGVCYLRLGRWQEAARHLQTAIDGSASPRDAVQRSIVLADRSIAHLLGGDLDTGCRALGDAIDLAAETRGRVSAQRLLDARQALGRWMDEPSVRQMDARLVSALLG